MRCNYSKERWTRGVKRQKNLSEWLKKLKNNNKNSPATSLKQQYEIDPAWFISYVKALFATGSENISLRLTSSSKHFPTCNFAREIRHISFHISCICESKTIQVPMSYKLDTWHSHTSKRDGSCNVRNKLTTTNDEHRCYDTLRRPWPIIGIMEMQW